MGRKKSFSDDEIVAVVWRNRVVYGACTLGLIAETMGMTRANAQVRVGDLLRAGRLRQSHVFGSLRTTDERMYREPVVKAG